MSKKTRRFNYNTYLILPLILIVAIVPLIVRLKAIPLEGASAVFKGSEEVNVDLFSYYKMVYFLGFTSLGLGLFLYRYYIEENIYIKRTKLYYPMLIYTGLAILSTIFAVHREVALLGFMDRYEGIYVLIGYMVALFLAINLMDNEKQVKYLLYALGISSIVISIIGIFQYATMDIFATDFGNKLIIPSKYMDAVENIKFQYAGSKRVYGTLFNPNYVGVYMSLLFTLFMTISILSKERLVKLFFAFTGLLSLVNLLGSGSRTGIISLSVYGLLLIIMFRKLAFKRWKWILALLILTIGVSYGADSYTEGALKKRLMAVKDSIGTVTVSNLNDINLNGNKAKIAIEDYEINIVYDKEGYKFLDARGEGLEIKLKDHTISFKDEPYSQHSFKKYIYEDMPLLRARISTNIRRLSFDLVVNDEGDFKFLGSKGELADLEKAPSWGFEGRERMASSRGYIWSRSLPMLKDTLLLGYGPDTYALHFPNDDYFGKLIGMSRINILVDKPHNYYIQTGINTGVISLLALIALFLLYIKTSIRAYIMKKDYDNFYEVAGVSIFFAVISYLMVGFLNDSVISVAPVFWVLLGTGIGININLLKE